MDELFGNNADQEFFSNLERRGKQKLNLQKIFDENPDLENTDSILKYQNDKQLESSKATATPVKTFTWTTLAAKVVTAYNGTQTVGKVGIALLKGVAVTNDQCTYKLIIYRTKSEVLCTSTIRELLEPVTLNNDGESKSHQQMKTLTLNNDYLQFYDDKQNYWSVSFENKSNEEEFTNKLEDNELKVVRPIEVKTQPANSNLTAKTKLITRMSKMGQALPMLTRNDSAAGTAAVYQPTLDEPDNKLDVIVTPAALPRKYMKSLKDEPTIAAAQPVTAAPRLDLSYKNMEQQMMQMVLTEIRTENSEVRLNVSKVDFKLDKIMDKLDKLTQASTSTNANQEQKQSQEYRHADEMLALEEKLLEVKRENHLLKQQLAISNAHTCLPSKEYRVQLNELGICNVASVEDAASAFGALINKALELQQQITKPKVCENCATLLHDLTTERVAFDELCKKMHTVSQDNGNIKADLEDAQAQLKAAREELLKQKSEAAEQAAIASRETSDKLKLIMNNLYGTLALRLDAGGTLRTDETLATIAKTIKEVTLEQLK